MIELDIVIPVYNEGENIVPVLESFRRHVKTPWRALICYDFEEDDTLAALARFPHREDEIVRIKNPGRGPNDAVVAGLRAATAPVVMTHMADDDYNAPLIDGMVAMIRDGSDVVTGSRFAKGGSYVGAPWRKQAFTRTASFTLYHLGRHPVHDATNGFRVFSRRLLDMVKIESRHGFTYTLELAVKAHRLGWKVREVPAQWMQRTKGGSKFLIARWVLPYLRWYLYAFATTWLGRGPETVRRRPEAKP